MQAKKFNNVITQYRTTLARQRLHRLQQSLYISSTRLNWLSRCPRRTTSRKIC
ncbi:predicted protein [Ostreococcus lucimarinus CCE9901]|uniref:Uncharacterized protein n=1 Tax=Ostreococcus lucimarinus (strain CCE9901) TaxID=436017 RepID=A4RSU7_OSTLU|nr:predicted protein [Ostreococcus lucimarinus CCE9901]ABO94476.1 predicted protein [Ostreococcus lucimarinus CCE9901]|eukprot:XP_001416183.1 predicted protein [Ostreococcus lucimarinus CCE9901]